MHELGGVLEKVLFSITKGIAEELHVVSIKTEPASGVTGRFTRFCIAHVVEVALLPQALLRLSAPPWTLMSSKSKRRSEGLRGGIDGAQVRTQVSSEMAGTKADSQQDGLEQGFLRAAGARTFEDAWWESGEGL